MRTTMLLAATMLAIACPAAAFAQALFDVKPVDRDAVPAGTPAAFEVAFEDATRNEAVRQHGDDSYTFVPLHLIPLSNTKVALVSTGASDCTGHACSGVNAVHYLDHDEGPPKYPYTRTGEWLDVGATGTFGNPATSWGWTDAIAAAPVLYTEGGGVWQGHACSFAALTELTPAGPVEIASFPVRYSNSGAVEKGVVTLDGRIVAAERGRSFTISYSGTQSFEERYVKGSEGKYALAGKSRVPGC